MYIKVYFKNGNIEMYDCSSYTWHFESDIIRLRDGLSEVAELRKSNGDLTSVFVMNDNGKTIDSYHF